MTLFLIKLLNAFLGHFNRIEPLKHLLPGPNDMRNTVQ